jgi:cystathionine beta-lyase
MPAPSPSQIAAATARAKAVIAAHGLPTLTAAGLEAWQGDQSRTTYLFDPRSDGTPPSGFRATPGTTLVQQTDRFIAVKGARVVLWDPGLVRSTFAALWLNRMGIMAHVLLEPPQPTTPATGLPLPAAPRALDAPALDAALAQGALVLDLRPVAAFRAAHLAKARRAIRPQIPALGLPENSKIVLVASDSDSARAALVAHDLATAGHAVLGLTLDPKLWQEHGLPLDKSVADAPLDDPETVQFCAGRHSGNLQDARLYLAWETGLLDRLSAAGLTPWPALLPHQRPQAGAQTWL